MADVGSLLGGVGLGGSLIGAAVVKLELDSAKYQAELKAAQTQTATGSTGMGNALAAVGGIAKAGMAAAGIAVVAFGANAIKAASDLGEAVNKSNVIFGDNAAEIESWAETGAEAFGLSKTAALDAAGGFGAMLQTAGVAVDESANMSKALVQLSGDMASFNNIDPTEALEKLRSGLAGEAEPLRRFGVFLSEAAVQQEAYQSGIAKTGEELTEAQKVQARYNIIFEQTTKQQGDFQRTADSLPNQLRTMRAEFENISAEVGEKLLPIATSLLGVLKDMLPVLKLVGDGLAAIVDVISDLVKALTFQSNGFAEMKDRMLELGEGVREGTTSIVEFDNAMKALAEEHELNFEASQEYETALRREREATDAAATEIAKYRKEHTRIHGAIFETEKATREMSRATKKAADDFEFAAFTLDDLATETDLSEKAFDRYFRTINRESRELARAARELEGERWISQDFKDFLSLKGPQWVIEFANKNETQQRRVQKEWEATNERTKTANTNLGNVKASLDKLDKSSSRHKFVLEYEYVGFDPSKPGMGGSLGANDRTGRGGPQ